MRNTHERRNAYFLAGVLDFWEERDEETKLRIPLFSHLVLPPLYYTCRDKKSRYKIAGIDYEKHGNGVCLVILVWVRKIGRACQGEKDRRTGLWTTTVRLQHSRDEFLFVALLFSLPP